ncbi:MAG TPA: PRC-barrel domain-containing protein [Gammaproteobacteria bacterium]|nr:PRC-barrel domain-containing protein [Gammaproteobacteria bacterium]
MQTIKLKRLAAGVSAALLAGAIAVSASAQPRDDNAPGARRGPEGGVEIARSDRTNTALQGYREYMKGHDARVSKLVGTDVHSSSGDTVGEIDDVLLSSTVGAKPMVVISVGGTLGVGEKLISMPLDELKVSGDDELYIDRTSHQLGAEPAFKYGQSENGAAARSSQTGAGTRLAGLVGADVTDSAGKDIGDIDDILIGMKTGMEDRAVLSVGGVAGVGDKLVAVPFKDLEIARTVTEAEGSPKSPEVHIAMTADALKQMPEFKYDDNAPQKTGILR